MGVMLDWIKSVFSLASPVSALREQLSLKQAELAQAHSLIADQTKAIEKLQAQNDQLTQENKELKHLHSEASKKPLNYDNRGIV